MGQKLFRITIPQSVSTNFEKIHEIDEIYASSEIYMQLQNDDLKNGRRDTNEPDVNAEFT